MQREEATVTVMILRYCRDKHTGANVLCPECTELLEYACKRLKHCPFQENKTTCSKCTVHCYKPAMRERIREVMHYVGPRMILSNPVMALQHAVNGLRNKPHCKAKHDEQYCQ